MAAFSGASGGTTTTALANATIDRFIPSRTLEVAMYNAQLYKLARKQPIPKGESNTVTFIKTNHLTLPASPLPEADSGNATAMTTSRVSCVTEPWGAWVAISSLGAYISRDSPAERAAQRLGVNAARTIDREIVRQLLSGTTVYFGGTATARSGLGTGDVITTALMRKIRARMKRTGAPFYSGNRHVLVAGPEVCADIAGDQTVVDVSVYNNLEVLTLGEMGVWQGYRIVESNTIPSITNGGAHGATISTPAASGVEVALNASGGNTTVDVLITSNDADGFENVFYTLAGTQTLSNGEVLKVILPALPGTATSFNVYVTAQHATTPDLTTLNLQTERVAGSTTLVISGNGLAASGTGVLGITTGRIAGVPPATGVTVHPAFFFGSDYFVCTEIGKIETPRSKGPQKNDPLDRYETLGWKIEGFRTCITDHTFGGRMEVASLN